VDARKNAACRRVDDGLPTTSRKHCDAAEIAASVCLVESSRNPSHSRRSETTDKRLKSSTTLRDSAKVQRVSRSEASARVVEIGCPKADWASRVGPNGKSRVCQAQQKKTVQ
jgi:hypothetical protein